MFRMCRASICCRLSGPDRLFFFRRAFVHPNIQWAMCVFFFFLPSSSDFHSIFCCCWSLSFHAYGIWVDSIHSSNRFIEICMNTEVERTTRTIEWRTRIVYEHSEKWPLSLHRKSTHSQNRNNAHTLTVTHCQWLGWAGLNWYCIEHKWKSQIPMKL